MPHLRIFAAAALLFPAIMVTAQSVSSGDGLVTATATGRAACATISQYLSICNSLTPGFLSSSFSVQASCLCYDGTDFNPGFYDVPFSHCVGYYQTASASFYSSVLAADGTVVSQPCSWEGDVVNGGGDSGNATVYTSDTGYTSNTYVSTTTHHTPVSTSTSIFTSTSTTATPTQGPVTVTVTRNSGAMTLPSFTMLPATTSSKGDAARLAQGAGIGGLILGLAVLL